MSKAVPTKRQHNQRYREQGGWKNRKPIQVSAAAHDEAGELAKLGLWMGSTRGEVIEAGIYLLKERFWGQIQYGKRELEGLGGVTTELLEKEDAP